MNLQLLTETRPFDSCGGFVAAVVTSVEFDQFEASMEEILTQTLAAVATFAAQLGFGAVATRQKPPASYF